MRCSTAISTLAGLVLAFTASADPTTYNMAIDTPNSSVAPSIDVSIPLSGTLIGNYDAVNNPTGTQTRPGLFGGSGNQPIPVTIDIGAMGDSVTNPAGSFRLTVDTTALTASVSQLSVDLLGAGSLSVDVTAELLFSTFRTFSPNSLFIGGFPIPLPLGAAQVTTLAATQSGPAGGVLVPSANPGEFTFVLVTPVDVALELELLGQPFAAGPVPGVLPLAGTITLGPTGASMVIDFADTQQTTLPAAPGALQNVPVDLPTILPTGSVANLLLNADLLEGSISTGLDVLINATGEPACLADFNGDGVVNIFDYIAFGAAYSSGDPKADLNSDGQFTIFDYILFGQAYAAGCGT